MPTNTTYGAQVNPTPQDAFMERLEANNLAGRYCLAVRLCHQTLLDNRLKHGDRKVFAALAMLVPETGHSNPPRALIAQMAQVNVQMVSNSLTRLRKYGYIETAMVPDEGRQHTFGVQAQQQIRALVQEIELYLSAQRGAATVAGVLHSANSAGAEVNPGGLTQANPGGLSAANPGGLSSPTGVKKSSPPGVKSNDECHIQDGPPTLLEEYLDKSKYGPDGPCGGASATKNTFGIAPATLTVGAPATVKMSAPATEDLFADSDPPPPVEVKFWKNGVAFKPLGHHKFEVVSDQWITKHTGDLEAGRAFVAVEIEQFFAEPPVGSDGRPIRLLGFITSGFAHRYAAYCARRRAGDAGLDPEAGLSPDARRQLAMYRHV